MPFSSFRVISRRVGRRQQAPCEQQFSRTTHDAVELLILKRPPPPGHRFENNDCGGEIGVSRMNDWTRAGFFPVLEPLSSPAPAAVSLRRLSSLYEATRSSSKSFHVRGELLNNILRGRRAIFFFLDNTRRKHVVYFTVHVYRLECRGKRKRGKNGSPHNGVDRIFYGKDTGTIKNEFLSLIYLSTLKNAALI